MSLSIEEDAIISGAESRVTVLLTNDNIDEAGDLLRLLLTDLLKLIRMLEVLATLMIDIDYCLPIYLSELVSFMSLSSNSVSIAYLSSYL